MSAITNSTELANVSLTRLGESPISNITDTDNATTLVRTQYEASRTACFSARTWRFTQKKIQLSKLSAAPVNEYDNKFQLPSDLLQGPLAVYDSTQSGAVPVLNWELFGNEILTDNDTCVIDYVADVTDVQRWPAYFRELVILDLCSRLAKPITDSDGLSQEYLQRAWGTPSENYRGGWYRKAAQRDAGTSTPKHFATDTLIAARRGGF